MKIYSIPGLLVLSPTVTSFHSSAAVVARSFICSLPSLYLFNRRSLLTATMTTTASFSTLPQSPDQSLNQAITLLNSVYSPVNSPDFPRPMSAEEAGSCAHPSNSEPQRRYLWTDAFAVLAYQAISNVYSSRGQVQEAKIYTDAYEKLIGTVHMCLGKPRSDRKEDAMTTCDISPTGFVGLRIGKVESRYDTDYGMRYDGQYFHYIDKWLFALSRTNYIEDGLRIAKSIFPYFFSKADRGRPGGIKWKLSVNARPPSTLPPVNGPNDDTLNALIVYTMLETQRQHNDECMPDLSLQTEIEFLQQALYEFHPKITDDPLGWGLEAIFDQFVEGHPRTEQLRHLASDALTLSHISLPFRLYGALIGATVSNEKLISYQKLEEVKEYCVKYQFREMDKCDSSKGKHREDFAEINRVMLAVALLGHESSLRYETHDPMVHL